jgi:polar amino acid transport system substrate-binding protein
MAAMALLVGGASALAQEAGKTPEVLRSVKDIERARVALTLGSNFDDYARTQLPNATVLQFKTGADVILALKSGKADVAFQGYETARELVKNDAGLAILSPRLFRSPLAFGFNHDTGGDLLKSFNTFLAQIKADGTLDDMKSRWLYSGKLDKVAIPNPSPKGELRIGVTSAKGMPLISMTGKEPLGFDIELAERFAAHLGRTPRFVDLDIPTMIASLASNKIDLIGSTLAITEERAKRVFFSDEIYPLDAALVALSSRLPPPPRLQSIDDLAGKQVGLTTGTIFDRWAQQRLPLAQLQRFNATADMTLALQAGKLDAAVYEAENAKAVLRTVPGLGILDDDLLASPVGAIFRKEDTALRGQFNAWLAKAKADGTYEKIRQRWLVEDPEKAVMPAQPPAPAGARVVRVGVAVGDMPWVAEKQGRFIGHDVEMMEAFAASAGFKVVFSSMDFAALISSVAAGKVDIAVDAISINAERARQVAFSDPYANIGAYMLARQKDLDFSDAAAGGKAVSSGPPTQTVWERIHSNLVHEDRWKLIADGLGVTAIISVMSTIFGTILGAVICWMRMSRNVLLNQFAGVYIWLLRGLPVLVLLMIIYYIVFASVEVNPVLVASVAFGLNMAAYSAEMFRTGIEGVDRGQTEAGIAGGFTRVQAFRLIVMPQAMRQVLPVYKGEVISLVKMTSVVGYVAVQDLTKASDIIRSRTFDAFVPLIATAIIYLAIAWLVAYLLDKVEWRITPKHKRAGAAR